MKCSFMNPLPLYVDDDTYYFPDGAAFCKSDKPTAFMSAYALTVNPDARMLQDNKNRGFTYLEERRATARALTAAPSASSASSSRPMPAPKTIPVKKRPAGAK
jgi:hypothetical protein